MSIVRFTRTCLENLKRKGYLKEGAIVMADKFCSYYNYNVALKRYKIICNLVEGEHEYKQAFKISTPLTFLENNMKGLAFFKN